MSDMNNSDRKKEQFGVITKAMANHCHSCSICPIADKKPQSVFGKIMRWHRSWCPAQTAHIRVYGEKPPS